MKRHLLIATLLLFSVFSCTASETVEEKVYKAIFDKLGMEGAKKGLVVEVETLDDQHITVNRINTDTPEISDTTVSNFAKKSGIKVNISLLLPTFPNLIKEKRDKLEVIFSGKYKKPWKQFYKLYPNSTGVMSLSQVGVGSSRREAVVTTRFECGFLCGQGAIVFLELKGKVWKIKYWKQVWVS